MNRISTNDKGARLMYGLLFLLAVVAAFGSTTKAVAADVAPQFKIQQAWPIPGDERWGILTFAPSQHLLYVTRDTRVQVVDTETGTLAGEITGLRRAHAVALDPSGKYGYIGDRGANQVVVFDRASRQVTAHIEAGQGPDFVLYEPLTRRVFAFNHTSYDATVIDPKTNKVMATIPLPGEPEDAQADGKGIIFLNIETAHMTVRIDARELKVTAKWPLAPCQKPTGLAYDPEHRRLFAACANKKVAVVDAVTGRVVATPAVGERSEGVAYDSKRRLVLSSNGEGTLTVLSQKSADVYEPVQVLRTRPGARTLAFDASTGTVYLVTAEFGPSPAVTPDHPGGRPAIVPNTFVVLKVGLH